MELQKDEIRRIEILRDMPANLKKIAEEIAGKLATENRGCILVRYDVGRRVRQLVENESAYGDNAVHNLAAYLGLDEPYLYTLKELNCTFERDQIAALAVRRMVNGEHLTISHLLALTRVKQAELREQWIERALRESLSVRGMTKLLFDEGVLKLRDAKPNSKAKRLSAAAGLKELRRMASAMNQRAGLWMTCICDELDQVAGDRLDSKLVAQLQNARTEIAALGEALNSLGTRLQAAEERSAKLLTGRGTAPPAESPKRRASHRPVPAGVGT